MSDTTNRIGESIESVHSRANDLVGQHAVPSALFAYALGVGAGMVVVSLLANSDHHRHATATRRLGQQLLDAMTAVVPNSLINR